MELCVKNETELKWILFLMCSPYVKGFFTKKSGCKSDFERVVGVGECNKKFRKWIDWLIDKGVLEFDCKKEIVGGCVNTYIINYKKLDSLFRKNPIHDSIVKVMTKRMNTSLSLN